jgi:hypothetical protein
MNFRLTAALFAAIFILGAVLLTLSLIDDKAVPDTLVEELATAAVKAEEVEKVEIERPGQPGKIVMVRTGEKWEMLEPVKATADRFAVEAVVSALFRAKPTHTAELTGNLQRHGLEPPSLRVTLSAKGKSSTVNVGETTLGGGKGIAFVTTSARKRPIAVPRSALDSLLRESNASGPAGNNAKWTSDFRAKAVFSMDARKVAEVTGIKLTNKNKTLELTRPGEEWTFVSPANWGAADGVGDPNPAATGFTGVSPMLTALIAMQVQSPDDFIETPGDLKQYGLEPGNPDMVRVELKPKEGPAEVVYIGKQIPSQPPAQGVPAAPSTKWFVKIDGEPSVIRANAGKLEGLVGVVTDPNPIRDRTLLAFEKTRIDAIDLTFGGQTLKLRKTGGVPQWKLYGTPNDPTLVDPKLIEAMLNVLGERRTIRDFPPTIDPNFSAAELKVEVKLWADGVEADPKADAKAEPKLKGNPFALQIGRQEGDKFFVRRTLPSGAKGDFTLPERIPMSGPVPVSVELLPTLKKDRLALLDTSLPSFSPFGVSKVTITNGPAVTEVDKADDPASPLAGKWTFAKPDAKKGRTADGDTIQVELLAMLSRLAATRFIAETPTDAQLAGWGLDPKGPRMKVVVGMKTGEADKERVYSIGNDTGDGFVYARMEGKPAVFVVPKLVFDKLASTDLRDRTVARFDKTKVKGLRVRGWKEAGPEMLVREFEKKGTEWVAKGSGYTADGVKINSLLAVLDGLKAKTLVPGLPRPEHRFPPETESGFEITIELYGSPALSLNIAGETPDKTAYFGFSSQLPAGEQLFTVPADALRGFKASPGSLTLAK